MSSKGPNGGPAAHSPVKVGSVSAESECYLLLSRHPQNPQFLLFETLNRAELWTKQAIGPECKYLIICIRCVKQARLGYCGDMSEKHVFDCNAHQFSGVPPRVGKRLWLRSKTAPIYFKLFNLIHKCRRWVDPSGVDMVPIRLKLYHRTGVQFGRQVVCYGESDWVAERRFQVPVSDIKILSKQDAYAKMVAGYLKSLRVPQNKLPLFILKIFEVIEHAVPELPIIVRIEHVTVHIADNPITTYIKGLEKMRVAVASLDEAATTTACAICTDDLAHFRGGSDSDEDEEEQMIIRLPCSHLYHQDCIFPWLERHLACPYCRYSIPLELPTTTTSSTGRLRWPTLLMMTTGGILILCRLLKRA